MGWLISNTLGNRRAFLILSQKGHKRANTILKATSNCQYNVYWSDSIQEEKRDSPPQWPKMNVKILSEKIHQWHRGTAHQGFSTISRKAGEDSQGKLLWSQQLTHRKHTKTSYLCSSDSSWKLCFFWFLQKYHFNRPQSSLLPLNRKRTKGRVIELMVRRSESSSVLSPSGIRHFSLNTDMKVNHSKGFLACLTLLNIFFNRKIY